jgi:hypothetical protein
VVEASLRRIGEEESEGESREDPTTADVSAWGAAASHGGAADCVAKPNDLPEQPE